MAGKPKTKTPSSKVKGKDKRNSSVLPTVLLFLAPVALAALAALYLDVPSRLFLKEELHDLEILRDRTIFNVADLEGRGKGLIAKRKIEQGELILTEKPLLLVQTESSKDYLITTYNNWTQPQKTAYITLSYIIPEGDNIPNPPNTPEDVVKIMDAVVRNNAVVLKSGWLGVFPRMTRMNHACAGGFNAMYHWRETNGRVDEGELRVYAMRDIQKGEELLTTYIDPRKSRDDRRKHLKSAYGFDCACKLCSLPDEESKKSDERLIEMKAVYKRFTRWMDGHINGIEAIELIHRYWALSIEEGFWNERGQMAEEAAYVAAAHSDEEAAREWSQLAYHWSSIEWGSDGERAIKV
ncbi:hypothetical protein DL96DRAFT_394667 [Flagelloscypha sp. PMI_526]|nr:hypothetical protein DL96DRAFT_394667 [Flagelloscypha sp. PMI_526]